MVQLKGSNCYPMFWITGGEYVILRIHVKYNYA